MRILHIGDIAQQGSHLAAALRDLGHEAVVMAQAADSARYGFPPPDVDMRVRHGLAYPASWSGFVLRRRRFIDSFDVLHVHGGIRRWQCAYRLLEPPMIVHLHGSEAREGFGLHHLGWARGIVYSTPDLAPLAPGGSRWLPQAVPDIAHTPPRYDRLRILHAPTDPGKKDTRDILGALGHLAPEGRWEDRGDHQLLETETLLARVTSGPLPHARLVSLMDESNLVVDHLGSSPTLGITAIEAMLMERAAVAGFAKSAYARALAEYGLETPPAIHIVGAGDLEARLRALARDPDRIGDSRDEARRYARTVHDPRTVAARAIRFYKEASL